MKSDERHSPESATGGLSEQAYFGWHNYPESADRQQVNGSKQR